MYINNYIFRKKIEVDKALKKYLPNPNTYPQILHKAMYYSIFNGGKRIRPILTISTCQMLGGNTKKVMPLACAIELIHSSTLVLDDLPCMDNDDFRRGKPTCHKVFGEDIAILAGYALFILAFEILSTYKNRKIIQHIARAVGSKGLIGGQAVDLELEKTKSSKKSLEYIHLHKTAMLIEASVYTGAIVANADRGQLKHLSNYGKYIGLAFQISDDLLDIKSDQKKVTYPSIFGIERSKQILQQLKDKAISNLSTFGKRAHILKEIAEFITNRAQ